MKKRWLLLAASIVIFIWLIWALQRPISRQFGLIWRPDILGLWGDSFGALNALFSAFAFLAVLVTLWMQSRELRRQQDQIDRSHREQQQERFESTYFRLLDLMRELKDAIRFRHSREYRAERPSMSFPVHVGEDALRAMVRELDYWSVRCLEMEEKECVDTIKIKYMSCIHAYSENGLSPYFRIVYSILRRIDEAEFLSEKEKASYGNLLRSQITSSELTVAGINGMVSVSANFSAYLVRYKMFKYLVGGPTRKIVEMHYSPSAFQGRD